MTVEELYLEAKKQGYLDYEIKVLDYDGCYHYADSAEPDHIKKVVEIA